LKKEESTDYDETDIMVWNGMTATDKKKMQNDPRYKKFITDSNSIFKDKKSSMEDIMAYSS
jgi:hypothetical protein